jgi:regulator of CtrA degradation
MVIINDGEDGKLGRGLGMGNSQPETGTIDFLARFTGSEQFERTFKEGMGLVEETANYLDGDGRVDSRVLDRTGAIAYATESMRLTTRLMQMASWLLLQRAIATGELTGEDVSREKHRINLAEIGRGHSLKGGEQLPDGLTTLVERSLHLLERIRKLDTMVKRQPVATDASVAAPAAKESPVSVQISMLERAFKMG